MAAGKWWISCALAGALVGSAACSAAPPRPFVAQTHPGVIATEALEYGHAVDAEGADVALELDLFEPEGDVSPARPAVVFVHGGGFTAGTRAEIRYLAEDFARRGYVTVSIDYRLRSGTIFSFASPNADAQAAIIDARHDAQAAVRWVKAHAGAYRIDPTRVAIAGYSAGAITALGVAFRSDDPGDSGTPGESSRVCTAVSLSGVHVEGGIDPSDPQVTLIHGSVDDIVPTEQARATAFGAAASGRLARYHEYPGVGHLLIIDPRSSTYRDVLADALSRALSAGPCS